MKFWQTKTMLAYCLRPLEMLFRAVAAIRRGLYHCGVLKSHRFSVPVIVVGNIYIGGTGKTPVVIALVEALKQAGYHPGVVSRGYKAQCRTFPHYVLETDTAAIVGDEPLLIARRTQCPVFIAPKRVDAVSALLKQCPECDVVVTDDGLQHYALQRDIEIAVLDADRHFGNGFCLPAGPLREPVSRLQRVNYVITNGQAEFAHTFKIEIEPAEFVNVLNPNQRQPATAFGKQAVSAVSGIGSPQRFYRTLQSLGLVFTEHDFPDHHVYTQQDFESLGKNPIVMTEKDAVKCSEFATEAMWYLPITAKIPERLLRLIFEDLERKKGASHESASA